MIAFDDIKPGARLRGLTGGGIAEIVQVARFGADALNLVFRLDGRVAERLVYRGEETAFELGEAGHAYDFDADGALLRLASEAYRIRLAHLFDPHLAVSASQIEALSLFRMARPQTMMAVAMPSTIEFPARGSEYPKGCLTMITSTSADVP